MSLKFRFNYQRRREHQNTFFSSSLIKPNYFRKNDATWLLLRGVINSLNYCCSIMIKTNDIL